MVEIRNTLNLRSKYLLYKPVQKKKLGLSTVLIAEDGERSIFYKSLIVLFSVSTMLISLGFISFQFEAPSAFAEMSQDEQKEVTRLSQPLKEESAKKSGITESSDTIFICRGKKFMTIPQANKGCKRYKLTD